MTQDLEQEVARLKRELATLRGENALPEAGCSIAKLVLDDEADVLVEYQYVPGRPAVMYLRNGDPGYPADPEEVDILSVFISGHWIDARVIDAKVRERWEQEIIDAEHQSAYKGDRS
jgi:hypothetical protein